VLGTDGYGLSEPRADLRNFFEIDADYITHAALVGLYKNQRITKTKFKAQIKSLQVNPDKVDPMLR
jgi:pyruvate dehydrogenase E1 component